MPKKSKQKKSDDGAKNPDAVAELPKKSDAEKPKKWVLAAGKSLCCGSHMLADGDEITGKHLGADDFKKWVDAGVIVEAK